MHYPKYNIRQKIAFAEYTGKIIDIRIGISIEYLILEDGFIYPEWRDEKELKEIVFR